MRSDVCPFPVVRDAVEQLVAGLTWVTSVNSPDAVAKAAPAGIGSAGAASAAPHGSTQAISDGLKNVKYIVRRKTLGPVL